MHYLDTSAVAPIFLPGSHAPAMQNWLRENSDFFVSDFSAAEFSSVVSRLVRMGQLAEDDANIVLRRFDRWKSSAPNARVINTHDITACERLVRQFSLRLKVPDALHLSIAGADNLTLVTFDRRLAEAARLLKHPVVIPKG